MQRDKKFADARSVMKRIGARLVRERRLALSEGSSEDDAEEGPKYGKDLLSLLVKANMAEASSMSDEDVQDRGSKPHPGLSFIHVHAFHPLQKSPPLLSPATRRAVPVSLGVYTAYQTMLRYRSACVTRFTISAPNRRTRSKSSLSCAWIML